MHPPHALFHPPSPSWPRPALFPWDAPFPGEHILPRNGRVSARLGWAGEITARCTSTEPNPTALAPSCFLTSLRPGERAGSYCARTPSTFLVCAVEHRQPAPSLGLLPSKDRPALEDAVQIIERWKQKHPSRNKGEQQQPQCFG